MTADCTEMVQQNAQEARVHSKTLKSNVYVYNECQYILSVRSLMMQISPYHWQNAVLGNLTISCFLPWVDPRSAS